MNLTVSTLIRYLKNRLDNDQNLRNVTVEGEISNYRSSLSGHVYFTLKDENSSISCVMFASRSRFLTFKPINGDKVLVNGAVSLFEASGSLQFYVNAMKKAGLGDLYQQYEELKNKLAKEGLFATEHKKQLKTAYPERIAILVGDKTAAMSDIVTCFNRRWPLAKTDYYPVIVQGNEAPECIISALKTVDELNYDAIILARGGGSFEDLFCFSDERLVRTIYNLKTFIICGIGHEQDFSLADFVADLRAPTPTASVELITPDIKDVIARIDDYQRNLAINLNRCLDNSRKMLGNIMDRGIFRNPQLLIEKQRLKLDLYFNRLNSYQNHLNNNCLVIERLISDMAYKLENRRNSALKDIETYEKLLNAYCVNNTLKRGFTLVYSDNRLIKSKDELEKGSAIDVLFVNGKVKAIVEEK